ncbi:MAG: GIY-YIG nuclease family protein [Candidatus Moranbacteria bacterium]|nr:GIY-YIG nuclease family protein [Candidatus Moranbacteria bacterium]
MYYVYIIVEEKTGRKYIGSTADLKERIQRHNSKRSTFTSRGEFWKLIYYEAFIEKKNALREEQFLKSGKGRERIKYLFEETLSRLRKGG